MSRPVFSSIRLLALSLLAIPSVAGCGEGKASLVSVESEKEANRILVALEEHRIHGADKDVRVQKRKRLYEIRVPLGQIHEARRLLLQLDIPREPQGGFDDMFRSAGLIPTKTDERAKLMHAMSGELEQTLETVDRVVRARVHLVLPEHDALRASDARRSYNSGPTAAVLIKYVPLHEDDPDQRTAAFVAGSPDESRGDDPAGVQNPAPISAPALGGLPISARDVKKMVAGSVEDLREENVTVVFAPAPRRPAASPEGVPPAELGEGEGDEPEAGVVGLASPRRIQNGLLLASGTLALLVIMLILRLRRVSSETLNRV